MSPPFVFVLSRARDEADYALLEKEFQQAYGGTRNKNYLTCCGRFAVVPPGKKTFPRACAGIDGGFPIYEKPNC